MDVIDAERQRERQAYDVVVQELFRNGASTWTFSPLKRCRSASQGKKITTRHVSRSPVGALPSHSDSNVPVTRASSHTPCGPMTMSVRSKWMSGNALSNSM